MKGQNLIVSRRLSLAGFSFLFAFILSFQFEGQVLYNLLNLHGIHTDRYISTAIVAHFVGLIHCGMFVKTQVASKNMMLGGMAACLAATIPFIFVLPQLWMWGLIVSGYFSGCAVAAWGYHLKAYTPKNERIKSCADVLIYSNLLMIATNVVAMNRSPIVGLCLAMFCLIAGIVCVWMLPVECANEQHSISQSTIKRTKKPLLLLCLFVFIITINSGLMYQVINPAFEHLTGLVSWYWAVPYIVALVIMRNLPENVKRSNILYVGMAMIVGAFISFMLLERNASDYLVVDTLMLGACGIFDLFWWSILGEILEYTDNPAQPFGIGLAANVFGVFCGGALGLKVTSIGLSLSEVTVIALTVVCVTLTMIPYLNTQLVLLLKSHAYLTDYENMSPSQQAETFMLMEHQESLTVREQDVLRLILSGKSNRAIAEELFVSENTVKTHVRSIFAKYEVGSRAELISSLLTNQTSK